MASRTEPAKFPLVVIVGPTASGKTSLAVDLAQRYGGEIICADSRTIYKDMDIGTAKPTVEDRSRVPHWGLDLVVPGEHFSVADFKAYADNAIADIQSRGRIPFLVGGTGLYVDAVVFGYEFGGKPDGKLREQLQRLSVIELQEYCHKRNVTLPENTHNKRHLIRTIEQNGLTAQKSELPVYESIIVGIATDKVVLRSRITQRVEQLFDDGVVEEAIKLGNVYGWDNEAMTGNAYALMYAYLKQEMTFEEMKEKFTTRDWRLAKRQLTWMRRNPHIHWTSLTEAELYLSEKLALYKKA